MLLDGPTARKIARGEKTTMRRPTDSRTVTVRRHKKSHRPSVSRPFNPQVGQRLPITIPDEPSGPACYVVISNVERKVQLGTSLDAAAIRSEGYRSRSAFAHDWVESHDRSWVEITRKLIDGIRHGATTIAQLADADLGVSETTIRPRVKRLLSDGAIYADEEGRLQVYEESWERAALMRFNERHIGRLVDVITFEVDRNPPKFMATRHVPADYVDSPSNALDPEAEVIEPERLDQYAAEARARHTQHRGYMAQQALNEKATLEERLAHLRAVAKRRGVDVRSDVRAIERRIEAIQKKIAGQQKAA
jgi:hypothetical protein